MKKIIPALALSIAALGGAQQVNAQSFTSMTDRTFYQPVRRDVFDSANFNRVAVQCLSRPFPAVAVFYDNTATATVGDASVVVIPARSVRPVRGGYEGYDNSNGSVFFRTQDYEVRTPSWYAAAAEAFETAGQYGAPVNNGVWSMFNSQSRNGDVPFVTSGTLAGQVNWQASERRPLFNSEIAAAMESRAVSDGPVGNIVGGAPVELCGLVRGSGRGSDRGPRWNGPGN